MARYLSGMTPERYEAMGRHDRWCLNEALDEILERESGPSQEGEVPPVSERDDY